MLHRPEETGVPALIIKLNIRLKTWFRGLREGSKLFSSRLLKSAKYSITAYLKMLSLAS